MLSSEMCFNDFVSVELLKPYRHRSLELTAQKVCFSLGATGILPCSKAKQLERHGLIFFTINQAT